MTGKYFIYTLYLNGRISIRDRPYATLKAAESAVRRKQKRTAGNPQIKDVKIYYQYGIADASDIDVKKII